jgi:hypothetical protein
MRILRGLIIFIAVPFTVCFLAVASGSLFGILYKLSPHTLSAADSWPLFKLDVQWPVALLLGTLLAYPVAFFVTLPMNIYWLLRSETILRSAILMSGHPSIYNCGRAAI